jgi:hypothetical protein
VSSTDATPHPLLSDGGLGRPRTDTPDPLEALDDLMQVVEALCPTWPKREVFADAGEFKL